MTRASIREYSEAVRWRYLQAPKKENGKILDEFTKVTGYHRKAIIRLLHRVNQPNANRKRGRPRQYSAAVVGGLRIAWEATDRLCCKRLHPFSPSLLQLAHLPVLHYPSIPLTPVFLLLTHLQTASRLHNHPYMARGVALASLSVGGRLLLFAK